MMELRMKLILTCCSSNPLLVMLIKSVIKFPKVPNYQSRTQKLLFLNNGLFTADVLSAMIPTEWPTRSPDFTPCDFFLWCFVEGNVFTTPPASIEDMRD